MKRNETDWSQQGAPMSPGMEPHEWWPHDRVEQSRRDRLRQRINQVWDVVARERSATSNAGT